MNALFAFRALLFMAEMFVASSVIVALAWLLSRQRAASQRHLAWLGAFGAMGALPILALTIPAYFVFLLPAPEQPVRVLLTPEMIAALQAAPPPSPSFHIDAGTIVYALISLWVLGLAFIALRGSIAAFALYRMRRDSTVHHFGHIAIEGPRCELRVSDEDCGPLTWGILRPVVLLPNEAEHWPRARLEAVLLHELAHVRRMDSLTQLVSLAISALFWPNPLVWIAAARLRREAETSADDAVLAAGVRPSAYADELLQIASEFRVQRLSLPLAMAAPSALEARVKSVLEPNQSRSGVTSMDVFKIACLGLMAATATVFAMPSLAQDTQHNAPVATAPLPPPETAAAPAPAAAPQAPDSGVVRETDTPGSRVVQETQTYRVTRSVPDNTYVIDAGDNGRHRHIVRHWRDMSPQERARIQAQVDAAMAKAQPEIERAMRAVEATRPQVEQAMREVEAARPQIEAAMAEAMRDAGPAEQAKIRAAMEKARAALARVPNEAEIDAKIAAAMAKAQAKLAAAQMKLHDRALIVEDGEADTGGPDADDAPLPPPPPPPPAPEMAPSPPPPAPEAPPAPPAKPQ